MQTNYLENSWYVAAWGREIARAPLARTLLDQPIVFYRKTDGTPVALEDRCAHRHLPLSMGRLIGDDLQCGYHGLKFDCTGVCVEVPGQDIIPPRAKVRSYPLVERYHWVWIWMGDPALADPSRIPNWWWADHPDWKTTCPELIHVKCHYQLVNDNVLDVSHLAYVHQSSIGSAGINEFPVVVEREENSVRMKRWIIDRPAPPMYQAAGRFAGKVDRWQIVEHVPPCFSVNLAGCQDTVTGAPEGNKTGRRIDLMALSAPTPETAGTTHYFFQFVRGFQLDDPTAERMFGVDFVNVFREDIVIFEAQQRAIDRNPNAPKIDLKVDGAPLAARRMLDFMVKGERECTSLS